MQVTSIVYNMSQLARYDVGKPSSSGFVEAYAMFYVLCSMFFVSMLSVSMFIMIISSPPMLSQPSSHHIQFSDPHSLTLVEPNRSQYTCTCSWPSLFPGTIFMGILELSSSRLLVYYSPFSIVPMFNILMVSLILVSAPLPYTTLSSHPHV